jgi:hypothetical protein
VQLNGHLSEHCRKKAALCLARIFRKLPPEANVITPAEWCLHFRTLLANPFSPGPQLAIMGLLCTVLERSTDGYESLQPLLVENLSASVTGRNNRKEFIYYLYYGILCPWLQCKCALGLSLHHCAPACYKVVCPCMQCRTQHNSVFESGCRTTVQGHQVLCTSDPPRASCSTTKPPSVPA